MIRVTFYDGEEYPDNFMTGAYAQHLEREIHEAIAERFPLDSICVRVVTGWASEEPIQVILDPSTRFYWENVNYIRQVVDYVRLSVVDKEKFYVSEVSK